MTTFANVLAALARGRVDFIVVGGLAVARAGFVRTTDDLDVLVEATDLNLTRLISVLARFGSGSAAELTPADLPLSEGSVRVAEEFDVDLFTQMSGLTYADLIIQTAEHLVEDESVRFLTAEGLLRLKSPSLRPKDQIDADVLRRILRGERSD